MRDIPDYAQKAKNLLDDVNKELKMAAEVANKSAKQSSTCVFFVSMRMPDFRPKLANHV